MRNEGTLERRLKYGLLVCGVLGFVYFNRPMIEVTVTSEIPGADFVVMSEAGVELRGERFSTPATFRIASRDASVGILAMNEDETLKVATEGRWLWARVSGSYSGHYFKLYQSFVRTGGQVGGLPDHERLRKLELDWGRVGVPVLQYSEDRSCRSREALAAVSEFDIAGLRSAC